MGREHGRRATAPRDEQGQSADERADLQRWRRAHRNRTPAARYDHLSPHEPRRRRGVAGRVTGLARAPESGAPDAAPHAPLANAATVTTQHGIISTGLAPAVR